MKTIHETLILVRKELLKSRSPIDPKTTYYRGLCYLVTCMLLRNIITSSESDLLIAFIDEHSPEKLYDDLYFWKPYLIKPRLQWLTRHINLTE